MKKSVIFLLVGLLAGAALMYLLGPARFPNKMKPAEPTSFNAVTAKLDAGGDLYAYFDTARFIRSVEELIANFAKAAPFKADDKEAAVASFVIRLLGKSGLNEISGVGLSNVAVASGLQRTRMVVHHDPDKNTGLIWQLAQTGSRELTELDLLPADTALAAFNEFRLDRFWTWVKQELEASGIPGAVNFAKQAEPMLAAQGMDLPKLLGSLTGSVGYVVTLDKERTISLPGGESALTIPEPGLGIVIGVKDATLFDLLKSKLPMAAFSEKDGRKTLQFPSIPAPLPLEPCVTADKGILIAASTPRLVDAILQARAKGDGLVKADEYKELARNVPARGNGFAYVSPRLWRIYANFLEKAAAGKPEDKPFKDILFSMFPRELKAFGVMESRADGVVWTSCHNMNPEMMVLMPLASVAGVAAAVAAPNLVKAADKAKVNGTQAVLKTVGIALEAYLIQNGNSPSAKSFADLQAALVPFYVKELPLKDNWGNELLYKKTGSDGYLIASSGKDGLFQGWQQKGEYPRDQYDQDIIFANGIFIYGPEAEK
ncbi:MAG: type II secretion system protein GspG [Candidatus Aminicenantes bacterium]|nr:type II secretion system protein GspG [Candidatus Aminicenantes bacterium]